MNEKKTLQHVIEYLAVSKKIAVKDAESFSKALFELIEEALEKDYYVKIKGLGTFRLIEVDSRESVNINTGERFRIQEHTKISFTPDNSVKEAINRPFSHFETVVLENDVLLDDEYASVVISETHKKVSIGSLSEQISEDDISPTVVNDIQEGIPVFSLSEKKEWKVWGWRVIGLFCIVLLLGIIVYMLYNFNSGRL